MLRFQRPHANTLRQRLEEPVRWLNIVAGPRRVGKTTMVGSVLGELASDRRRYISADPAGARSLSPALDLPSGAIQQDTYASVGAKTDTAWLIRQWEEARAVSYTHLPL